MLLLIILIQDLQYQYQLLVIHHDLQKNNSEDEGTDNDLVLGSAIKMKSKVITSNAGNTHADLDIYM